MNYIYGLISILMLSSCARTTVIVEDKSSPVIILAPVKEEVSDLKSIPQDVTLYSENIEEHIYPNVIDFDRNYFNPWNIDKMDIILKDAMWAYSSYQYGNSYGENLQLLSQKFFDEILENSSFQDYSSVNKRAISLRELNIRAFPTSRPLLMDPNKAGEGFPFDYLQNSILAANKPLFISHYSKDKKWVFIKCSFTYGWVKSRDIVYIEKKYTQLYEKAKQVFITQEGKSLYTNTGSFLFKSKIGMMFPLIKETPDSYIILALSNYKNNKAYFLESKISKKMANQGNLAFNSLNINNIIKEVSKTNYGWGGMYSQRDCSSTLRDFFLPFGVWLPRNSYQQSHVGKSISLENMSDEVKIKTIKKHAIAFRTILYKKGHIVLYAGTFNDKIIIYHNTWAIKTEKEGNEGRFIIGKPIFSTLEVGKNLVHHKEDALIIKQLLKMSTL
ncbi:SH3 domain-containing protein [Sulfurimonas sp.]|uniref:SH3 domain-containing protein n=1 Tax=Sulfurimonas sp. TaxID=2022749 RepID=UPI0025D78F4C|nr:SH3 domain-containing protein [Sulfurimonas sp.]MBT5935035.1 glycoside hydrolase [Sulfurimonas sp.]